MDLLTWYTGQVVRNGRHLEIEAAGFGPYIYEIVSIAHQRWHAAVTRSGSPLQTEAHRSIEAARAWCEAHAQGAAARRSGSSMKEAS